jgi:hypothetical protein
MLEKLSSDKNSSLSRKIAKNDPNNFCLSSSAPIQKQCVKLIDLYMDEIIEMFVKEYTPEQVAVLGCI